MKLSLKMKAAISEAINSAAMRVVTEHAPICDDIPPEGWNQEQKAVFDHAHQVAYLATKNVLALFS